MSSGRMGRRQALKGAAAVAMLAAGGRLRSAFASGSAAGPAATPDPSGSDPLADLARRLIDCERSEAFAVAGQAMGSGMSPADLLGAVFLAGIQEVQPRPVGFKLHCVMMVGSALQLAPALPPDERWLAAFFNLDDFKNSQRRDAEEGDWRLGPPPEVTPRPARVIAADLAAALRARDARAADEAVTVAARTLATDDIFEVIWPEAAGDFGNIGHKIIHAAQMHRTLSVVGRGCSEPALRSLVYGLVSGGDAADLADGIANRQRLAAIPAGWQGGERDGNASLELLARLRTCSSHQAAEAVVAMLGGGVAPHSIWDGLRLAASEMLLRKPGLLPVHPLTSLNALHIASSLTRHEDTRRLLLLQAAAYQPLYRENLSRRLGLEMTGPGVDAGDPPPTPGTRDLMALRRRLFRSGREAHQYKYAAAVIEEGALAARDFAGRILHAGDGYLPSAGAGDSEITARAREVLAGLGIRI